MKYIHEKNNFIYLFFSLNILLFASAMVAEVKNDLMELFFSLVIILMLFASIKSIKTDLTLRWSVYVIIVLFTFSAILGKIFPHQIYIYFILLTLLCFYMGVFIVAFKQVVLVGEVDGNKIMGSITLYIILGLIWAVIYLILLSIDPHSFSGIEAGSWQQTFSRAAYYSFVTLTTLGYGDILPKNSIAEFFVYMEAIAGVFYMAIIVASLISLHSRHRKKQ